MAKLFFKEVLPGMYVGTEYKTVLRFPYNMVAIKSAEDLILVDPLEPDEAGFRELESYGRPATVLLTSDFHERSAPVYRKRYNARVLAHADAIPRCHGPVDSTLADGELLPGGITVIHMPGTAPGMVAFAVDRPGGVLIVGDILIYDDFSQRSWLNGLVLKLVFKARDKEVSPFPLRWASDQALAAQSCRKLLNHSFEALLVTHGLPLLTGARAALARNLPA